MYYLIDGQVVTLAPAKQGRVVVSFMNKLVQAVVLRKLTMGLYAKGEKPQAVLPCRARHPREAWPLVDVE
jgi:hypothetical protein